MEMIDRREERAVSHGERALAIFYYRLALGEPTTVPQQRAALLAWNRLAISHGEKSAWCAPSSADDGYIGAVAENLRYSGFGRYCRQWQRAIDDDGAAVAGADVRRFLKAAIEHQFYSPHLHHDVFALAPEMRPGSALDIDIRHPFSAEFWTLCLTESGRGRISGTETQLALNSGEIVLLPPEFGGVVSRDPHSDQWACLYLAFRPRTDWLSWLKMEFPGRAPIVRSGLSSTVLNAIRRDLQELTKTRHARGGVREALCFNLVQNALIRFSCSGNADRAGERPTISDRNRDGRARKVASYLAEHIGSPCSLDEAAGQIGLSPAHLTRLFKQEFGTSPIRWRDSIRLAQARERLAESDVPLAEIAKALGWDDPFYFSRRFKQCFGLAPDHYRRRIRRPPASSFREPARRR